MTPADALSACFHAFRGYRLRASLAALGVTIGVATIVTGFAIGEGARRAALDEISGLGIDNVFVRASRVTERDGYGRQRDLAPQLRLADAEAIGAAIPHVRAVAVARSLRQPARVGDRSADATFAGVSPSWHDVAELSVTEGRWLTADDAAAARKVGVIGPALARQLFGNASPIGHTVRVADAWVRIVGVLSTTARAGQHARAIPQLDAETALFVPFDVMDARLGEGDTRDRVQDIAVRVGGAASVEPARRTIEGVLDRRYSERAWELIVPRELLQARLRAQRTFNVVLYAIGALALLVSGVGIMNIMLASVVERTHEIGIRRAFGARRAHVLAQFAMEASLLSAAGAVAGLPLGWAFAFVVAALAGWPVAISGGSVVLALALAALVGVGFGVYPASVAAKLQPAAALRAE
jgi:putative ABC transport system permease protein